MHPPRAALAPILAPILALILALATPPAALAETAAEAARRLPEVSGWPIARVATVAQTGRDAERLARIGETIALPPGFALTLYAVVPQARHMAVLPGSNTVMVGTTGNTVWAVRDADGDGRAETVSEFAAAFGLDVPNGVCFAPDGTLYVAERNRILAFPAAAQELDTIAPEARELVAAGVLIPPAEESGGHTARVCRIGPDGMLYVSLGQPYNVAPPEKLALYDQTGIGGIIRIRPDGTGREVYTLGIRNSVGHDFHPVTGELWFTDNQVDRMGDDIPPGEINRQTAAGQHFGFPWYGGGDTRTHEYAGVAVPVPVVFPTVATDAHAADLGMTFYRGSAFPPEYRHAIFSAQHGSWDRSEPIGARVMVTFIAPDGAARTLAFAEGWNLGPQGYSGRPVDVAELPDGSLLVSDDHAGAIWRIAYTGGG